MSYLPIDLMTSERRAFRRLKVEDEDPGYNNGTQFRLSIPLTVTTANPIFLRVTSAINFELISQTLATHESGITFEAYRSLQGVETGTFNTAVPIYKNNSQSSALNYDAQVIIDTGGGFTPNAGQLSVETLNVLSASSTAQRSSVEAGVQGKRGLGAGVYFLSFSKLGGAGNSLGVYTLIFNEKP
jgi:hypothetical protein